MTPRLLTAQFRTVVAEVLGPAGMEAFRVTAVSVDASGASLAFEGVPPGPRADENCHYEADRRTVVEAAAATLTRRARRLAAREVYGPGDRDWAGALKGRYPGWFACEVSLGPGWADLVMALAERVAEIGPGDRFRFTQIKEKYGTLRAYHCGDGAVLDAVDAFEIVSGAICETCGAPGVLRGGPGQYLHTACNEHAGGPRASDDGEGWL